MFRGAKPESIVQLRVVVVHEIEGKKDAPEKAASIQRKQIGECQGEGRNRRRSKAFIHLRS